MKSRTFRRLTRITGLALLAACFIAIIACSSHYSGKPVPIAENGVIDLRYWDFDLDGPIRLNGQWEFFWKKQIDTTDASLVENFILHGQNTDGYFYLPNEKGWKGHTLAGGEVLPHLGYGILRLKVLMPAHLSPGNITNPEYAIGLAKSFTAHTLQVFSSTGEALGDPIKMGTIGRSREEAIPQNRIGLAPLPAINTYHVIWQISNYHYYVGGPVVAPLIGTYDQVHNKLLSKYFKDAFIVGLLCIIGLYHLVLFALNIKDRSPLWLGIFCIQIAGYSLVVDGYLGSQFQSHAAWVVTITCYYSLFLYPTLTAFQLFLKHAFPEGDFRKTGNFLVANGIVIAILSAAMPLYWIIQRYLHYYFLLSVLFGITYALVVMIRTVKGSKRKQSVVLLSGFGLFTLAMAHDVLGNFGIIPFYYNWTSTGMCVFIFFQAIIVSMNNRQVHREKYLAQKQAAENLKQADRLKDEFLANTSHELRTPLTGIIGLAESMVDGTRGAVSTEQKHDLIMMISSGKRLSRLVDDILEYARMKTQDLKIKLKPTDIRSLVDISIRLSQPLLKKKQISLQNEVPESLPLAMADENRIQQVLFNLLGNAIKFTNEGKITVSAVVEEKMVTISVRDTGIGIPGDKLETIFRSFEQADQSIARLFGGTGLGLTISRHLVELHGGTLRVNSTVGEGSEFIFDLPIAKDQTFPEAGERIRSFADPESPQEAVAADIHPDEQDGPGSEKTILIVDDEPVNLQILFNHLKRQYTIIPAESGPEALARIESRKPDLVLLDVMMPRMSGFEVCQKIRETFSPSALPIIMLTAKNRIEDLIEGFRCGASDYISKPFAKDELLVRIDLHLKLQDTAQALDRTNRELVSLNQSLESKVQERTAALARKTEDQKELLHVLCHDLSSPFVNIKGILQLSRGQQQAYFDEIKDILLASTQNGLNLIGLIKEISALDEGKHELDLEHFDLNELIAESTNMLRQRLSEKHIAVKKMIESGLTVMVEKTSFVNSVMNNIISNAVKFSYPKSSITISAYSSSGRIIVKIRDDGMGMPERLRNQLFDMSKSTSRPGTGGEIGTGFGMPLVKKFVESYGGEIQIESRDIQDFPEDHGTSIFLKLNP